jgi:acetylornithine/N-succinyldiaminopimelate aminotransferase
MTSQPSQSTEQLLKDAAKSILFTASRPDIVMERGEGMYLWDTDGGKYLDFVGGWAVTGLGHSPRVIKEALEQQAALLVNSSPSFYNKPMIELARLLTDISCFDRVFFGSSGAEANESAIKLARKYGAVKLDGAFEIITLTGAFHGRTLATMSATGKKQWKTLFAPKPAGFKHVPLNDWEACRDAVNRETCAVMLEPIQGESGVYPVDPDYLAKLRGFCNERGIMLIFDEIQTGIGRTGTMFAYEQCGVEPDVMTLAKGLGGGFPVSAMLAKERFNVFEPGDQGGTYTGQPLAMAVALAVVKEVMERGLPEHAKRQGSYITAKLQQAAARWGIERIRGNGLLLAFDLPEPDGHEIVVKCRKRGLLINSPNPNTIRLMPALIVTKEDIDAMFDILDHVIKSRSHSL